jgi:ABC-type multidrug transport system fused ATPase/permease subunit
MIQSVTSLFFISALAALFTGLRGSLFWMAGSRANYNIRVKLHRNLLLQEAAFFDMNETGYLLSRLNNDVNKIGQVISYHVNVVFRQLAQCLFGTIYMIKISPLLSLYTIVGIAFVAVISAIYGDFNRELSQRVQDKFADATAVAETSLSMSETVRSFDGVEIESNKYEIAQSNALELEEVQVNFRAIYFCITLLQS